MYHGHEEFTCCRPEGIGTANLEWLWYKQYILEVRNKPTFIPLVTKVSKHWSWDNGVGYGTHKTLLIR